MGYSLTTTLDRPFARSLASPKTHVPGSRLQERGHRYYSASLSRWISRDPIGESGFVALVKSLTARRRDESVLAGIRMKEAISAITVFVANSPVGKYDVLGLVLGAPTDGKIRCNKDCKPEITGCKDWGAAESCCKEHEEDHLKTLTQANWCTKKTIVKTLPDGTTQKQECCPDRGKTATYDDMYPDLPVDQYTKMKTAECSALKAGMECCWKLWNGSNPLTEEAKCRVWQCIKASWLGRSTMSCGESENDPPPPKNPDPQNCKDPEPRSSGQQ
jgi:hypothetical protein